MESTFKIVVVGAPGVGKTSLLQRYVNAAFSENYKGTIGVDFSLKVLIRPDGRRVKLHFWDIAGQEQYVNMTRVYYKETHAAIIMFDITDLKSFEICAEWKRDLDAKCTLRDGSLVPVMLLANKSDMQKFRKVEKEKVEKYVADNELLGWSEISVKQDVMVNESIEFLVKELLANEKKVASPRSEEAASQSKAAVDLTDKKPLSQPSSCQC